jgi:periplasmic divalent cation tolerance protein
MKNFVVLVTTPSAKSSQLITQVILKSKLAACVNRISQVQSQYRWKGKVVKSREQLLIIKTTAVKFLKLEKAIKKQHPYSVPEIIALPIIKGSRSYLDWIRKSVEDSK